MKKIIFTGIVGLIAGFISGAGITYIFCKKKADDNAYSVYKEEVEKFKNRWENTHMVSLTEDTVEKKPEKPLAEIDSVDEYLGAPKNASETLNDNININNAIEILADAYALEHFYAIRWVEWQGVKWKVNYAEVQRPQISLTLGGIYHEH